jgi:hypothetical protein
MIRKYAYLARYFDIEEFALFPPQIKVYSHLRNRQKVDES